MGGIGMNAWEQLEAAVRDLKKRLDFRPAVGVVLGSGLGAFAERIRMVAAVPYGEIEGFPVSTVSGHCGRFVFGYAGEVPIVVMQGRVHYYEGYRMEQVVLPIRLMAGLGIGGLMLTNAAGGVNRDFACGDFMLITDHISDFVPSPLIGPNDERFGKRFPDNSQVYNRELCDVVRDTAGRLGLPLREGVYLQLTGPNFETPAEVRMCRILGADAVGMSTACEAMAAHHMGVKVCGISCISNMACGITEQPLTHEEVKETADRVAPEFQRLLWESIQGIARKI